MGSHTTRLRIATLALLLLVALFTLTFVISASMALHTSYGMTKIVAKLPVTDEWVFDAILGLRTVTVCSQDLTNPEETVCQSENLSSGDAAFDDMGSSCPVSAGNWVIAAQSLILVLLIWPIIAIWRTDMVVRWKRASSLGMLSFAFLLSLTAIGVWYSQCVRGFNLDECADCEPPRVWYTEGEVSGAYGFECVIMVMLLASTLCSFAYMMLAGKTTAETPLVQSHADSEDAYYRSY